jgi:hypothetical protein
MLIAAQAPEGTLISFATQPGSVAQDGVSGNSPYAQALAREMRQPGLDIFQTFNQVGLAVKRDTGGGQMPWVSTSPIDGNFYFVAPKSTDLPAGLGKIVPPPAAATAALSPASPALDVRRFDGIWVITWTCESTPTGLPGFAGRSVARASNGVIRAENGKAGVPGWVFFNGTIEPDGSITVQVEGLSGPADGDPYHRPTGTKLCYKMVGMLEGADGVATRSDRDCDVRFAKQFVPRSAKAPSP